MAARYGGEEFVVILPQTDSIGALVIAERFRAAIAGTPWPLRPVTASFGVAAMTPAMPDAASLIALADASLYASKAAGRYRVTRLTSLPVATPLADFPD